MTEHVTRFDLRFLEMMGGVKSLLQKRQRRLRPMQWAFSVLRVVNGCGLGQAHAPYAPHT